ncbi:MAG: hypothetical protein SGPRY_010231 [Prymnesium sp.]
MLCSHDECRVQVADAGCMPALAVALGSSRSSLQRTALALTQQLSASKRACSAMLDAGVAAPLAAMLANSLISDTEVVAAVLECIRAIAAVGMPQAQTAVRNAGAVPHLIQLMSHEQPRVSNVASTLVAELCPGDSLSHVAYALTSSSLASPPVAPTNPLRNPLLRHFLGTCVVECSWYCVERGAVAR